MQPAARPDGLPRDSHWEAVRGKEKGGPPMPDGREGGQEGTVACMCRLHFDVWGLSEKVLYQKENAWGSGSCMGTPEGIGPEGLYGRGACTGPPLNDESGQGTGSDHPKGRRKKEEAPNTREEDPTQ